MIVDHLNTGLRGGAAIAACRIHESLRLAGVTSRYGYSRREATPPPDESYRPIIWPSKSAYSPRRIVDWATGRLRRSALKKSLKRALRDRPLGLALFSYPQIGWKTSYGGSTPFGHNQPPTDIIHLHWIANFIDYPTFFASLPNDLPIVWTLHDMNPFTGGCHCNTDCRAFETECGNCPQLGIRAKHDFSNRAFHTKRLAIANKNLHIVGVSHWIEREARSSKIFAEVKSFQTIHSGLEIDALVPQERSKARSAFALPDEAIVLGFGAVSIEDHHKGLRELLSSLSQLRTKKKVIGLVFGKGNTPDISSGAVELRNVGYIQGLSKKSLLYSAMDFFILPSLAEALGMTGLEAMACGVPVVAFATGGIPDYVRPNKTGTLVPAGDIPQLANAIDQMIESPTQRHSMGKSAREMVVQEFSSEAKAQDYLRLYESLLAR